MAQAQRKSAMAREAGKQASKAAPNPISKLESTTDTATVRAARPTALATGKNYTGQYLYDRFVNDKAENKEDLTKMDIVRNMVDVMDAAKFGQILGDMVSVAKAFADGAVKAAKEAGNYNSENPPLSCREADARLKTARNHQTVMRTAFGALKFCADALKAKIGDAELSYRMVRDIGATLLKDKGINWDGTKAAPTLSPAERAARKDQETETQAMLEIQKAHPRQENESRPEYFARIDGMVGKAMKEKQEEQRRQVVEALTKKVRDMAGENLPELIDALLSAEPEAPPVKATEAKADTNLH